jgi:hypothetical protein
LSFLRKTNHSKRTMQHSESQVHLSCQPSWLLDEAKRAKR